MKPTLLRVKSCMPTPDHLLRRGFDVPSVCMSLPGYPIHFHDIGHKHNYSLRELFDLLLETLGKDFDL